MDGRRIDVLELIELGSRAEAAAGRSL
jgi:hypothetical protein